MVSLLQWSLLIAFSTWRLSSLLYGEKPFAWLRKLIGVTEIDHEILGYPDGLLGSIWECFWCLSLIVSIILSTLISWKEGYSLLYWFILFTSSGAGALWVEKRIGISKARL